MDLSHLRYLVAGSGFFGATIAERIARDLGERVVVIEKLLASGLGLPHPAFNRRRPSPNEAVSKKQFQGEG